jgi:hypothetical protein
MWNAVKQMLGSKKFVATLVSAAVWGVGRIGWNVDEATLAGMVAPFIAYIVGQGIADTAKRNPS